MKDKKKKKGVAVIISIGPKMPKKPMDAATPDMKKYGSMPMKKAFELLKQNYTRDSMPPPRRYDDEGFDEYDMEDMGPPYGKPEFGDEDARQAEMNEAERAAIMAEGMPEMRRPRSAPRPGDPRFADPNKPRPRMPKNVFANR